MSETHSLIRVVNDERGFLILGRFQHGTPSHNWVSVHDATGKKMLINLTHATVVEPVDEEWVKMVLKQAEKWA